MTWKGLQFWQQLYPCLRPSLENVNGRKEKPLFTGRRGPGAMIHPTAVADQGAVIGSGTKVWHNSHIMPNAVIGKGCNFGQNVFVGKNVTIGNNVKIQNNVSVYEGVTLEDDTFCGTSCVFANIKTPHCAYPRNTATDYMVTLVKKGASIGANATIVCGVTIGEHALIGAGAVITKDIPANAVAYGNPADLQGLEM